LQGDLPAVQEAEAVFHSFNTRYQSRIQVKDKQGDPKWVVQRQPLLLELFKLADWANLQKLLSHSKVGRDRKSRANKKHRSKQRSGDPKAWFLACREKREARLLAWEAENHPRLLRILAEAEQDQEARLRLQYEVLNDLEARLVDHHRALGEFQVLQWRVLLGVFTQTQSVQIHRRLEKLAKELWDDPEARLKEDLAKRLPPIATDWAALDQAMVQSLAASGETA